MGLPTAGPARRAAPEILAVPGTSAAPDSTASWRQDAGSVTPLVIGMVVCLLLLGAGVTAATSAFLARQNLQHSCDGAADSAADAARSASSSGDAAHRSDRAHAAALRYLHTRHPGGAAHVTATGDAVRLDCTADAGVTWGALFGVGTVSFTVHSTGRSVL